ncbi:MAG: GNAT family N-acetyltransferase [Vulcanimicrobiaceae bacterium]
MGNRADSLRHRRRRRALVTDRLLLREPVDADAALLLAYHARNAERFAPWDPRRPDALSEHLRWIVWRRQQSAQGSGRSFLAFDRAVPAKLAGVVNLDAIGNEAEPNALLGYSLDGAYEGRGYACEAAAAVVAYAFDELRLTRLIAHYDPANERSGALLRRLGFVVEAVAADVPPALRTLMRPQVMATLARPRSAG